MRWSGLGVGVIGLGVALLPARAQLSARQIVANNLRVRGGAARFEAVRSFRLRGELRLAKPAKVQVWFASAPERIRIEVDLPQGKLAQGWDGTRAWQQLAGQTASAYVNGAPAKQIEDQALNGLDLFTAPGVKVALVDRTVWKGKSCYRLRITIPATGDQFIQYVDAQSWLVIHEEYPGGVEDIGDYRRTGGLLLAFAYASGPPGKPKVVLQREEMVLNPRLPAGLFKKAARPPFPGRPPAATPARQRAGGSGGGRTAAVLRLEATGARSAKGASKLPR
ncbi:MAG: hypothetical protein ACRD01_15965 [Terriglobales bacterium]